jgi:hypothetical protein
VGVIDHLGAAVGGFEVGQRSVNAKANLAAMPTTSPTIRPSMPAT